MPFHLRARTNVIIEVFTALRYVRFISRSRVFIRYHDVSAVLVAMPCYLPVAAAPRPDNSTSKRATYMEMRSAASFSSLIGWNLAEQPQCAGYDEAAMARLPYRSKCGHYIPPPEKANKIGSTKRRPLLHSGTRNNTGTGGARGCYNPL